MSKTITPKSDELSRAMRKEPELRRRYRELSQEIESLRQRAFLPDGAKIPHEYAALQSAMDKLDQVYFELTGERLTEEIEQEEKPEKSIFRLSCDWHDADQNTKKRIREHFEVYRNEGTKKSVLVHELDKIRNNFTIPQKVICELTGCASPEAVRQARYAFKQI